MIRYHCKSTKTSIILSYLDGQLIEVKGDPHITPKHMEWLYGSKLLDEENLKVFKSPNITVEALNITAEEWWKKYGYPKAKKQFLKTWAKKDEVIRWRSYNYIEQYKRDIARDGVAMLYPSSYLNEERWLDEE